MKARLSQKHDTVFDISISRIPSMSDEGLCNIFDNTCKKQRSSKLQNSYDEHPVLFEHCSWRVVCAGDVLDRRLAASRKARIRDVELVTNTVVYLFCRYEVVFVIIFGGFYFLCSCFSATKALLIGSYPSTKLSSVRVSGWLRAPGLSGSNLTVDSLFLQTRCRDLSQMDFKDPFLEQVVQIMGFTIDLNFPSHCETETRRVYFTLEGSRDGETFEVVGASSFRWTRTGIRFIVSGIDCCLGTTSYDYNPPWPWYFGDESVLFLILSGTMLVGAGVCAIFRHHQAAKCMIAGLLSAMALTMLISFAGFISLGKSREAFYPSVCFAGLSSLSVAVALRDQWIAEYLLGFGIFFLGARALNDCIVFDDCAYLHAQPPLEQVMFLALGGFFVWKKRRTVARTVEGVAVDWPEFCAVWSRLLETDGTREALERLRLLTERVSGGTPLRPRQYNRAHSGDEGGTPPVAGVRGSESQSTRHVTRRASTCGMAERVEPGRATFEIPRTVPGTAGSPVRSVCQLYSQALCVAPLLFEACSGWAADSGGRLDRYTADYIPSRLFPETLRRWMLAGFIKEPGRAIAKLLACYDGDVSCLLDVCRCRIVFDRMADLARCAEAAAGRADVRVVRLRNGLAEEHDAGPRGGFRAVVLNVRFDSDFTRRLGLENHVCEVQLLHRAFADVRKAGCHARYVDFRDLRGHVRPRFDAEMRRGGPRPAPRPPSAATPERPAPQAPAHDDHAEAHGGSCCGAIGPRPGRPPLDCGSVVRWDTGLDATLRGTLEAAARHIFLRFTLGAAGSLDQHASDFQEALNKSSSYSVLFSSKPHAAYVAKPMGKARTLLMAAALAFAAGSTLCLALSNGRGRLAAPLLRLRPLELLGAATPLNASAIAHFGLLDGECRVSQAAAGGPSPQVEDGSPAANGYYFTLSESTGPEGHPARWVVEASDGGGGAWTAVGRCAWVTVRTSGDGGRSWRLLGGPASWLVGCTDGALSVAPLVSLAAPLPRGAQVRVEFGLGEEFAWLAIGFLALPLGWGCALVAALLGRVHAFRPILVAALVGWCAWSLAWYAIAWRNGAGAGRHLSLWVAWSTAPALCSAVGFLCFERRLVLVFLVDGLLFLAQFALLYAAHYRQALPTAFAADPLPCSMSLALGIYLTGSGLVFYWLRWRVLRRAGRLLDAHRARYDELWAQVLAAQQEGCLALKAQIQALVTSIPTAAPQQMTRSRKDPGLGGLPMWVARWWADLQLPSSCGPLNIGMQPQYAPEAPGSAAETEPQLYPLFSLDQLFVQAICVQPMLLRKTQQWAAASGGLFPRLKSQLEGQSEFIRYSEDMGVGSAAVDAPVIDSDVKWCKIKSVPRAVEKVVRSYGLDVSRLVDVCRQAIAFEELAGISECLRIIASDPDVAILRVKNRLDPAYDAAVSGGYRDVNLNVKFTSAAAVRLGVEMHVCEVQLMLRGIAELKSDEGHRHYVECRNLRAD